MAALDLADLRGHRANLGLEHDPAALDPGEGPAGLDQLHHPRPVRGTAVRADRRYAYFLGEHVHRGREQDVKLARAHGTHQRSGAGLRCAGDGQHRLHGPDVAGPAPVGREQIPHFLDGGRRADDRRAAAALQAGPPGEGRRRARRRRDRHEIGARIAERGQPAAVGVAPELGAEPSFGIEAGMARSRALTNTFVTVSESQISSASSRSLSLSRRSDDDFHVLVRSTRQE